ncbi:MAG: chromate transporter [Lachnospiraceae bacterium]|nr:chromate transporter [Lachnospiraceae bacterium]
MNELVQLFTIFAQIGAVTFGGGYAMLPILTREFVDRRHWVTDSELTDYFAIGQCTPGIIAVNVATFIGNKRKGLVGGIVATLGLVSIPIVIITIIAAFLSNFAEYALVKNAFAGIRVCVCVLIINAILRLWKKSILDAPTLIIFLVVFALAVFSSLSPILLVVAAAAAGILLRQLPGRKGGEEA